MSSVQDVRYFIVSRSPGTQAPHRRRFLLQAAGTFLLLPTFSLIRAYGEADAFPVQYSDEEWQRLLGEARFKVMRQSIMETPLSSDLLQETRPGIYVCAGCGQALFSSQRKLHNVGAWPTFSEPIKGSAITLSYRKEWTALLQRRIYCARCGGYLGMVFNDGEDGFRFAINGLALQFVPARSPSPEDAGVR